MNSVRETLKQFHLLPSPAQELLLQASLLSTDKSLVAWEKWRNSEDIDYLDHASNRLLPLLFYNLEKQGITDVVMARYKGTFKKNWYKNQLLFGELKVLLKLLQNAGIEPIVLKGAALLLNTYPSYGHRPMADLDVLVAAGQIDSTVELIERNGWKSIVWESYTKNEPKFLKRTKIGIDYFSTRASTGFRNSSMKEFDLHTHAFAQNANSLYLGDDFWKRSEKVKLTDEISVRVLSATDTLLHTLTHGLRRGSVINLRWIADAVYLIRSKDIDWELLLSTARELELTAFVKYGLLYMKELLDVEIPEDAMQQIREVSITTKEATLFKSENRSVSKLTKLKLFWARHNRIAVNKPSVIRLILFTKYLQRIYLLEQLWQVPLILVYKAIWRKKNGSKLFG